MKSLAVVLVAVCALHAQDANPFSADARQAFTEVKSNMRLLSEDFQEGQTLGSMKVINPFRANPEQRELETKPRD